MFNKLLPNIDLYSNVLKGLNLRSEATAQNIANKDTPNYKRKVVSFEEELKQSIDKRTRLKTTNERHIPQVKNFFNPVTQVIHSGSYRQDGNNVNIDRENLELYKTYALYDAVTKQINGDIEKMRMIITEGGK